MSEAFDILPVEPDRLNEAMRFLAAGNRRTVATSRLTRKFISLARDGNDPAVAWALRRNRPVGVAMTLDRPGRSAVIYHCPASAPGVDPAATVAAIDCVSQQALQRGIAFVQALTDGTDSIDGDMLLQGGFEHLADLETLKIELPAPPRDPLPCESSLTFRPLSRMADGELDALVGATHEQSLDCPGLTGLRSPTDILAGHRASHRFTPETWWIADLDSRPAGVCLVNDTNSGRSAMIVYLGVIPHMRGRSLARAMVRHAETVAARSGHKALRLGVDMRNTYARNAYLAEGMRPVRSSRVFFRRGLNSSPVDPS